MAFELRDGVKAGVGRSFDAAQHALMEVAELLPAHGRGAALNSGDFDVLAVADIFECICLRSFQLVGRHSILTSKNEIIFC